MRRDRETAGESAVTFGILDDLVGGAVFEVVGMGCDGEGAGPVLGEG